MSDNKQIVARSLLHATYVENIGYDRDAVIVSEIVEYADGTTEPNLKTFRSPKVSFWITQEQFRDHTDKKEFESVKLLDEKQVYYKDKDKEIFRALNGYSPNFMTPKMRREVYQSPYIYGANISVEALVAMKYKKDLLKAGRTPHTPTTGFFDIEKSLLKSSYGKLPLMSFVCENTVYLACKRSFMSEERDGRRVDVTPEDILSAAHEIIDPLIEQIFTDNHDDLKDSRHKLPFTYTIFVGDTEVEMIRWIFGKMHETKVSFIGVWNIGFDIPEIIKVLEENNIPLAEIFSHPSMKQVGAAYAKFREDKRDVAHWTQKWHWLSATAHFQFVDSMCLYSYIRIVDGKETSYALDDVLKKFGLGGKLKIEKTKDLEGLQTEDWHRTMLSKHFVSYALYAMWDTISLQILEWRNNDLTAMMLLGDTTPPKFFVNQTIRVTNALYEMWQADGEFGKVHGGQILGTGVDVRGDRDESLLDGGGAVLEPQNMIAKGLKLFEEWPSHTTQIYSWLNDFDFAAQYPSAVMVLNISKQAKVATLLNITGDHVQRFYSTGKAIEVLCSYLITPNSNGVELGVEFFDLPDYTEINDLFLQYLETN